MLTIANFINGEFVGPVAGRMIDDIDPSTGAVFACVPDSDADDVNHAVAAAKAAFPKWSQTPAAERSKIMLRIADLIERNLESLARAECMDNGKPLQRCRTMDIPRAHKSFHFFGTAILHERSDAHVMDHDALNYTLRRPRGVCGLISPWNLPLYLLTWKVAPALAVGNTAVAKPSEVTPLTAHLFAELCREAGLPPGVLNIVHGTGQRAGAAIVAHPDVKTVSFTGSTRAGREIATACASGFKKLSLELGGKNANVVFADCDIEQAVEQSVSAAFANQGQICLCGSRLLVERTIAQDFVERFVARARKLRIGDPLEPGTDQGALVSKMQLDKVRSYVDIARDEGGRIILGGESPESINERCAGGYFFQPTVAVGLGPNCRVNQEEVFGPFVSIIPFDNEAHAIEIANATDYGLSASLWTSDVKRAHRVADSLEAGTVWVNCWMIRDLRVPFGGVKQSGIGREGGDEAMRFFTEPKNVCVKL
ncbi:MAG: aldehyde dehydrogenase [Phycisphaerae bacterium]